MCILRKPLNFKMDFFGADISLFVCILQFYRMLPLKKNKNRNKVEKHVLFTGFVAANHDDKQCWSSWSFSSMPSSSLPNPWSTKEWTFTACEGWRRTHYTPPPYGPAIAWSDISEGIIESLVFKCIQNMNVLCKFSVTTSWVFCLFFCCLKMQSKIRVRIIHQHAM